MTSIKQQIISYLKSLDLDITVRKAYSVSTPKYPMVTVQEISNSTRQAIHGEEQYANLGYQINIYAKDACPNSADEICLALAEQIDSELQKTFGFLRTSMTPLPDDDDDTVIRYAIRYTGVLDTINNYLYQ